MKCKVVKLNTDLICKCRFIIIRNTEYTSVVRRKPYLDLKETKECKNTILKKSRVVHPCHKFISLKEAIKNNKKISTKKVGSPTLVKLNKTYKKNLIETSYRLVKLTMSVGEYGCCLSFYSHWLRRRCSFCRRRGSWSSSPSDRSTASPPCLSWSYGGLSNNKLFLQFGYMEL